MNEQRITEPGRIVAVMEPKIAAGFALAGVETREARTAAEAEELVVRLLDDGDHALVMVAEKFSAEFSPGMKLRLWQSLEPVVVEVPVEFGMAGPEAGARHVGEIVEKAIGYSIKLE